MALSTAQKLKILVLLGHPAKSLDSTSLSYSKILTDRLTIDADTQALVEEQLAKIASIDTKITAAQSRASVKRLEDIEFFGSDSGSGELSSLRKERSTLIRELASMLDMSLGRGFGGGICVNVIV
jgi:hypothetical protein